MSHRNYKCHKSIDNYIDDIIKNKCNENSFINYLECEHSVKIILSESEKKSSNETRTFEYNNS